MPALLKHAALQLRSLPAPAPQAPRVGREGLLRSVPSSKREGERLFARCEDEGERL